VAEPAAARYAWAASVEYYYARNLGYRMMDILARRVFWIGYTDTKERFARAIAAEEGIPFIIARSKAHKTCFDPSAWECTTAMSYRGSVILVDTAERKVVRVVPTG